MNPLEARPPIVGSQVDPGEFQFEEVEERRPASVPRLAERNIAAATAKTAMPMDAMIAKPKSVKIIMGFGIEVQIEIGMDTGVDEWMSASVFGRPRRASQKEPCRIG